MFVIEISYQAPLSEIDRLMPAQVEHLQRLLAEGMFLIAGRQEPRSGGIILATGDRADVEAAVAEDPFVTAGAATARITEFRPSRVAADIGERVAAEHDRLSAS